MLVFAPQPPEAAEVYGVPCRSRYARSMALSSALSVSESSKRVLALALRKAGAFVLFLALAVVIAGVFGIVHDQISYTVSSEYYTRFKFPQFRLLD